MKPDCLTVLREAQKEFGTDRFKHDALKLIHERVNPDRVKVKRFSKSFKQRLFDKQGGYCEATECLLQDKHLLIPAWRNEVDHLDPDRADCDNESNLRLLHPVCNRVKSSMSLAEQAKRYGKTVKEILSD